MSDDETRGDKPGAAAHEHAPATGTRQIKHGRLRTSNPVANAFRLFGIVVAVALVASGSVVAYAAHDVVATSKPLVHLAELPGRTSTPLPSAPKGQRVGEVNMLLIGTDTRSGQGDFADAADQAASSGVGNNDVNILLHISSDHTNISVVSFPRDLEIPIPDCATASGTTAGSSKAMLNTALGRGGDQAHGLSCAVLTVEKLTGLDIPYAASVTFDGTSAISTAIGGIHVCLATPIVDDNVTPPLNLKAGDQTLVGPTALSFLRSRHGVGDGSDLGRISNQQVFMGALARRLVSSDTLSDPFTLFKLAKAAAANMRLSDTLSTSALLGIFEAVRTVGLSNMVFAQYPTGEDPDDSNRVVPNAEAAAALTAALRADKPLVLSGTTGNGAESTPAKTTSPSAPASSGSSKSGSSSGSSKSGSTPTPTTSSGGTSTVTLPPTITGQTAADETCSRKDG